MCLPDGDDDVALLDSLNVDIYSSSVKNSLLMLLICVIGVASVFKILIVSGNRVGST
jgi:hypothetical protein